MAGEKDDDQGDLIDKKIAAEGQDDGLQVEIEDDTPEQDRGRPQRKEGTEPDIPGDDEIGKYTKGVQDRMRQLRWEYHEERRAKEAMARENEQAIRLAKNLVDQNRRLQSMLQEGSKTLQENTKQAAESEISAIRTALSQAIAAGDNDKVAELNMMMGRATARAEAAKHIAPRFEEPPQQQPTAFYGNNAPAQPQEIQRPQVSPVMEKWLAENRWFQVDDDKTAIAMAAHDRLIRSGVAPESEAYFKGIDESVRKVFPDVGGQSQSHRRSNVAPTMRSAPANSGRVTLTASEARLAEKLGVPLKAYAAEKLKRMQQENNNG